MRRLASLAFLSRARRRLGFTVAPRLYHQALEREIELSVRDDNLRLLGLLGLPPSRPEPRLYFSPAEDAAAAELLRRHGIDKVPVILFVTRTSGGQPSEWFDERFSTVADHLAERHGAAIAFIGSAAQGGGIEAVRALMRQSSVNLAGTTDIPTLAALMCRSDLVVTLDTGPMHMARAAGVPTVIVAPAWQRAIEWLPLGVPHCLIVRRDDIACRECHKFYCATHECMEEIDAELVIQAADRQWTLYPPSAVERARRIGQSLAAESGSHGSQ
jgi:ADP-heptose:LPS heptosyltransferase